MARYTPRLSIFDYRGTYRYSWTICTFDRRAVFVDAAVVEPVLLQFLQAATHENIAILVYCFMPDHVHLLLEGGGANSTPVAFVSRAKQATGHWFARQHGARLWQKSSWDRVLRSDEDTWTVIRYILDNPVRARIVERAIDYPFSGSGVYSRDELFGSIRY